MELIAKKTVLETRPFKVEELTLRLKDKDKDKDTNAAHTYYRLDCPDWVNILAVTADQKAVLIRQARAGALKNVLEVPGGMMDPHEKDPTMAAVRELEEETGYTSQRVLPLGSLNPNPAIQNNRVHFFLAMNASPNANRKHFPDAEEAIETVLTDCTELDQLVRTGQLDHALAALCVMLAGKYVDIGKR